MELSQSSQDSSWKCKHWGRNDENTSHLEKILITLSQLLQVKGPILQCVQAQGAIPK